jgi:hypothetical protein
LTAQGFPPVAEHNWISFPHKRQSMIDVAIPPRCENMEIKKKIKCWQEITDAKGLEKVPVKALFSSAVFQFLFWTLDRN